MSRVAMLGAWHRTWLSVSASLRLLDGVAAELGAQSGVDLGREGLVLAGREARVEGGRNHRRGDALVDRLEDRPAALAGVLDVPRDAGEVAAVRVEGVVQELEQPRADDRAVAPDARDLLEVEIELGGLHDLEAFGVGLHQAVLDPVVDHLHEVARAGRADVRPAPGRGERLEDRPDSPDRLVGAAGHQAEALLEAPDPAGDADVEKVDPVLGSFSIAPLRVVEVRVAAVDDHIAGLEDPEQLPKSIFGDLAGRNNQTDEERRFELRR